MKFMKQYVFICNCWTIVSNIGIFTTVLYICGLVLPFSVTSLKLFLQWQWRDSEDYELINGKDPLIFNTMTTINQQRTNKSRAYFMRYAVICRITLHQNGTGKTTQKGAIAIHVYTICTLALETGHIRNIIQYMAHTCTAPDHWHYEIDMHLTCIYNILIWLLDMETLIPETGGRLNKKDGLTRYGNSHVKDKAS